MGSGASAATAAGEKYDAQRIPDEARNSDLAGLASLEDDSKTEATAGMTNNRLKKLALGIPGYKDQQRDYDPTLAKLELNKSAEMHWSDPKSGAEPKRQLIPLNPKSGQSAVSVEAVESSSFRPDSSFSPYSTAGSLSSSFSRLPQPTPGRPPPGRPMPLQQMAGPPPGVVARPFPREADQMMATFGTSPVPHVRSAHELVPTLPINAAMQPRRSAHQMVAGHPPAGAVSPGPGPHGVPLGSQGPMGPPVMAMQHSNKAGPSPGTTLPGGAVVLGPNMPRAGPPPMSHAHSSPLPVGPRGGPPVGTIGGGGGAGQGMPIVKETKNVKRNRAQLPDNLIHAKPTTGDWLNKRYIVNNFILLETLGTGSYGEVRLCKDRTNEKLFAIKIISKDFLKKKKGGKSDETYFEDIKREIAIMKKLLHPNILRLFEVLDDPKVNKIYLVLEYVKMGDLINILKKRGEANGTIPKDKAGSDEAFAPLSDLEVWNILRQLVAGIRYLHFQNIVHGDIKPQNLLLGEDGILKVADFGISQMLSGSGQKLLDAAGTPAFMAPELCDKRSSFSGQLADIWAMGATVFMLRFGHPPFLAKSIIHLFSKICNDPLVFPGPCDAGLRGLLELMLEKDPAKRISMQQLAAHPWMRVPPPVSPPMSRGVNAATIRSPPPSSARPAAAPAVAAPTAVTAASPSPAAVKEAESNDESKPLFQPPPSYEADEAAAAQERIVDVDGADLFASIGGIRANTVEEDEEIDVDDADLESDDDDDDAEGDDKPKPRTKIPARPAEEKPEAPAVVVSLGPTVAPTVAMGTSGSDIMGTNWGADVFQMVDDGDDGDVDDDVDDSDVDEKADSLGHGAARTSSSTAASSKSPKHAESRLEMSQEEQMRRSMQFIKKARRSTENVRQYTEPRTTSDLMSAVNASPSTKGAAVSPLESSPSVSKGSMFKSNSRPGLKDSRRFSLANADEEEETEEVTGEAFAYLMDTLSQQPAAATAAGTPTGGAAHRPPHGANIYGSNGTHNNATPLVAIEEVDDSIDFSTVLASLAAPARNSRTGVGAAFYSEQGMRSTQEDRCILLPNVTLMKALEQHVWRSDTERDELSLVSLACVFDGHNGWRSSQYLSHYLAALLVTHDKFLDPKRLEDVLVETCRKLDFQLCEMLYREEDVSGSTAIVAVFDGRRRRLTVAGVGDSLCVLSRNGRAVLMNSMHRLDNEAERERVRRAGGTVINSRVNGILAISRAFGDLQFKTPLPSARDPGVRMAEWRDGEGLVVSQPEIHSEIITPMTEFMVLATDGLWDIMPPQTAVSFVRHKLAATADLQAAAKDLVREAIARGSVDNVTVLLLTFDGAQSKQAAAGGAPGAAMASAHTLARK